MRIACIYLPTFPLQAYVREAPHRAGTSLALSSSAAKGSTITVCSRAAWAEGVRPQMAVALARSIAPDVEIVTADPAMLERGIAAVVDSLMTACESIDIGPPPGALVAHRAIYVSVPPRCRAATFGQRVLAALSRQGFRCRVGIADDRFTAYVAAVRVEQHGRVSRVDDPKGQPPLFQQACTAVPKGGSAAFLAPLPLSYLPLDADIQNLLETCGVKTLGDFAALPPPSVSRDHLDESSDFQELARGNGPVRLHGVARNQVLAQLIAERIELPYEIGEAQPLTFLLRALCDRVSLRLEGRKRAAATLCLDLFGPNDKATHLTIPLASSVATGSDLLNAVRAQLGNEVLGHPVTSVALAISKELELKAAEELELFSPKPHVAEPYVDQQEQVQAMPAASSALFVKDADLATTRGRSPSRIGVPSQSTQPKRRPRRASPRQQLLSLYE